MNKLLNLGQAYLDKFKRVYQRYEKYAPVLSFSAGFGWDNATLGRIDRLFDNIFLLGYILLLGGFIVFTNLVEKGITRRPLLVKYREWYPLVIQFLLGGLFSAYVVFYSQSASFTKTDLFLALLIALLLSNEFLRERLTNLYLQMALYFLACFSFFTFFLPVIFRQMGVLIFLLGGVISLLLVWGALRLLFKLNAVKSREQYRRVSGVLVGLYLLFNLFYWLNWIPPVPLSLKFGGIYHRVERVEQQYHLYHEKAKWYQFLKKSDDPFHYAPRDTVFCFASVFAPTRLNTAIFHHWQWYSPQREEWLTTDRLDYEIVGGRDGGYRGYTFKRFVKPGEWRVDVKTAEGKMLSRIRFTLLPVETRNYQLVELVR